MIVSVVIDSATLAIIDMQHTNNDKTSTRSKQQSCRAASAQIPPSPHGNRQNKHNNTYNN